MTIINVDQKQTDNYIELDSVPRSDEPIRIIPKYVFENCNQVTCNNYQPSFLKLLRDRAKEIKLSELQKMIPDKDTLTTKAEEFDWVYGLDYLEENVLSDKNFIRLRESYFTVDNIIEINGIFSRFCNDRPGKFRERGIRWPKKDLDLEENAVLSYLEGKLQHDEGADWYSTLSDPYCKPKVHKISVIEIRGFLTFARDNPEEVVFEDKKIKNKDINPLRVNEWKKKYGMRKNKVIDMTRWLQDHVHYFPPPSGIKSELQKSLDSIKDPKMHPIEKASRIWLEIVRLHISHEANKRTGKAIGSMILLAYGYLPPKIAKGDTQEYVKGMERAMEEKEGYKRFTQFIARKIIATYKEYSSK